jgi:hypothetical protein
MNKEAVVTTAVREVLQVIALQSASNASHGPKGGSRDAAGTQADAAMLEWQRSREDVIDSLDELCDAIAAARYPESDKAIILVRAIKANLVERPESKRKAAELDKYLRTDDIIGHAEAKNGFGIRVQIRQPLLEALDGLKPHLTD